jgi:NAD(P)-dependent dehydrogenase (short-subunit alcohol dehydrogenase family)
MGKLETTARLHGAITVVTGAAGGIGAAICRRFRDEGAKVAALDIREPKAGDANIACDVSNDTSVASAAAQVRATLGIPRIVVHAAAISETAETLRSSPASFALIYDVNVIGAVRLVQTFAPTMMGLDDPTFLFISSINGQMGAPGLSAYACSKGALDALTKTLALELAPRGIRVNAIAPASIDTPMLRAKFDNQPDPAGARAANVRRHPLGRLGTPEDVANLAAFLVSREASWITGSVCPLDGGAHLARR